MSPGSETIASVGAAAVLVMLLLAAGSATFLGTLCRTTMGGAGTGSNLQFAFPLAGLSLTALFLTVQVSLPVSLGLLAALTVVRFRTPVKEPEEIAFIVALVSVSSLLATFQIAFAGVLLLTAVLAAVIARFVRLRTPDAVRGLLVVAVPAFPPAGALKRLEAHGLELQSMSVAGVETVLSFRFAARSESSLRTLERDLAERLPRARTTLMRDAPVAVP
jgi:hypothetical protein